MSEYMKISTLGLNCPKPLIETRKALRKLGAGHILVVVGDHEVSREEIQQAVKDTGDVVVSVEDEGKVWTITIRRG